MNGLNQIRDAVVTAITQAGLTAIAAYSGSAARYDRAVAAVGVGAGTARGVGFGSYLGQRYDEASGSFTERYGRQMEAEIVLEIRAPKADECASAMETATQALMETLPSGLRLETFSWEPVRWEEENRMFLRQGQVKCRAFFTAEQSAEGELLLDFTLKGVMSS